MSKSKINQLVRKFIDDYENGRQREKLPAQLNELFENVKQLTKTKLKENPISLNEQDRLKTLLNTARSLST